MSKIITAIEELKAGRPIVLADDENRENEGDLIYPGETITPEVISFMMRECRGLICISISERRRLELGLPLQVVHNESVFGTNFAVPFDFLDVQEIGVTAKGRAATIREASKANLDRSKFVKPGFVVPVVARDGGVLTRRGQTEGSIDLVKLAGFSDAAVICEILDKEGKLLRGSELGEFCAKHNILYCTIEDIVQYRKSFQTNIRVVTECDSIQKLNLRSGLIDRVNETSQLPSFKLSVFIDDIDKTEHFAISFGDIDTLIKSNEPILTRIHSECVTGDIFSSLRCDCGPQLNLSLEEISKRGSGVLIYLMQEGRGIGLANKIKAYELQEKGLDTFQANEELGFEADAREYRVAAEMLKVMNVSKIDLLTNNPHKINWLNNSGIIVNTRIPVIIKPSPENEAYLKAKELRMGHMLS